MTEMASSKNMRRLERIVAIVYEVAGKDCIDPRVNELWKAVEDAGHFFPEVVVQGLHMLTGADVARLSAPQVSTANWRMNLIAALRSNAPLSESDRQFMSYAASMNSLGIEDLVRARGLIERARRAGVPAHQATLLDLIDDDVGF